MAFKKLFTLLIAVMFILPCIVLADDFGFGDDDFGGGGEEEDDFGSFEEEKKEDEPFDAEESAENKEKRDQQKSDEAMRDLLGEEAPEEKKEEKKEAKKYEDFDAIDSIDEEKKVEKKAPSGFKPVLLVKGGFTLLGQYREKKDPTDATERARTLGSLFGSVDEGLLGAEYEGSHVIAKGTMNIRTSNPFINKSNNPLMIKNLNSIQNGIENGLYELYGGMKFFGVFVKAGKMAPEYGLINTWQKLGMGFSTPFLTRSLVAVEGFIPETDAGFALGYENTFAGAHTIHIGLMLGTGSHGLVDWKYDKTMGLYGKLAYMHKIFQIGLGFQYRKEYDSTVSKELPVIGIGLHANVSVKGFEMPVTFDFNQMSMLQNGAKKSAQNILLSVAPGYAYSFKSDWADKVSLAVRFDLARGVYINNTDYLDYEKFKNDAMYFRIGVTANFFVKEIYGVGSYAGITFLVQPERKVVKASSQIDYGFTTLMLSAGAEF